MRPAPIHPTLVVISLSPIRSPNSTAIGCNPAASSGPSQYRDMGARLTAGRAAEGGQQDSKRLQPVVRPGQRVGANVPQSTARGAGTAPVEDRMTIVNG